MKLTAEQVIYCRTHYVPGDKEFGIKPLAQKFAVSRDVIKDLLHGVTYKNVGGKIHPPIERVSEEVKQAVIEEYVPRSSEANVQALAEKFHLSPTTVLKIIHEGNPKARAKRAVITDEIREAIRQEYVPYSATQGRNALAAKYSLSSSAVGVILRGIERNKVVDKPVKRGRQKAVVSDELKEQIIIAHDEEKLSVTGLATRFKLSRGVIKEVLGEAGITLRTRRLVDEDIKEQVIRLYKTGEHSLRELAERFEINRATLTKWVEGLKPPKPSIELDQATRERILSFNARGYGVSPIAKSLNLPQILVRRVINGEI